MIFDKKTWNNLSGMAFGDLKLTTKTGSYNSSTSTWTDGGTTYSLDRNGNTYIVRGTVPYEQADVVLGLQAGNRISIKLAEAGITAKTQLPSGTIVKVTNSGAAGGYNEYTKDAFETDGSLILVTNVSKAKPIEVIVTWETGKTKTYTFDLGAATLATE